MNFLTSSSSRAGFVAGRPSAWFARLTQWLGFLALSGAACAATLPEPDTVFYGRVLNFDHGHELLVTTGRLDWTIHPEGDGGRVYRLQTTIEPAANGTLSYRLKVPHEALVNGLAGTDVTPAAIPVGNSDLRYGHAEIRVNGELARILPPASGVFNVSSDRRAMAYRLDVEIAVPMPDSDGQGLPDWWQQRFFGRLGTDPNADPDADGWSNRREYLAGTDPNTVNAAPVIAWDHPFVDEGATELLTLRAVDSDTAPEQLVYTLTEEPRGAVVQVLFGATQAGPDGRRGHRVLRAGDTFTQAQLDAGRLVLAQKDPTAGQVVLGLSLTDGNTARPAFRTNIVAAIHAPTPDDGSGATVWLDAREAATNNPGGRLQIWSDRSGPKTWLNGSVAAFDGRATGSPLEIVPRGPLGQPVVGFNAGVAAGQQALGLPMPDQATVFKSGDMTVFAVVNPLGSGTERQQIVNGANFQLSLAGAEDHGRAHQVRFASESLGVVYSNHRVDDQWTLVTAWQDQHELSLELNGGWVGGPHPLDEPVKLGSDSVVGAKDTLGQVTERFRGHLAELLVFNRNLDGADRQRINSALLSKWFGWVIVDGSEEERDVIRRVPSTGLSGNDYRTQFIPLHGPDHHYILIGGGGRDVLQGGQNDDIIIGGRKADVISGGGGRDRFVFNFVHIHHDADTITDFDPELDRDVIDLSDLLRGSSRDLRDYVRLRTDGHNSYLDLNFLGVGNQVDHTIVLQNTVLRDEDRYRLWAQGNILTGEKRFPLAAALAVTQATAAEIDGDAAVIQVQFSGGPTVPEGLELPFELGGSAVRDVDYRLRVQRYDNARGEYVWEPVDGQELFVKLKAGDLGFEVRVEPIPNLRSSPVRTVQFALTPVPELYDVATAPVSVQIVEALQRVWVQAPAAQATPGGAAGFFEVSRQGSLDVALDVSVRMTGPAVNGVDYSYVPTVVHFDAGEAAARVVVNALLDENAKPARAAELVLESGAGYFVDPGGQAATVTIRPSLPLISVEAYEPLAVQSDGVAGSFLFRRQGPSSSALTVLFRVEGSAVMGRDYQKIARWVVFNPGATLVVMPIVPVTGVPLTGIRTVDLSLIEDSSFALGAAQGGQVRVVPSGVTFGQWKTSLFPTNPATPEVFAAEDTDGDGLRNLVEYAFGFDAKSADASKAALPKAVIVDGRLGVRFTRPVALVDVDYLFETSADLQTWEPASDRFDRVSSSLVEVSNEEVTYLGREPAAAPAGHQFLRVRVQLR